MINQGLIMKIQAVVGPGVHGGFASQLPANFPVPAYFFKLITDSPDRTLRSTRGLSLTTYQFDCFASTADGALGLATAIDDLLDGFKGTLPDPDATRVDSIFTSDRHGPEFSSAARNFWMMLEFHVNYYTRKP